MNKISVVLSLLLVVAVTVVSGCAGIGSSGSPGPLNAGNVNLMFVTTPDLAYSGSGDVNPTTANLTDQGLQRSLLLATYLKDQVLGGSNATGIYTLEPMTHLQTANNYPDVGGTGYIQQFALLNQFSMLGTTANSYPLSAAYAQGPVPAGVVTPSPFIPGAQGLDFADSAGNNIALATGIINANTPGFYVFSAPWETITSLLASIKAAMGYSLGLPTSYSGPNYVYVISITPSGVARLITYNANLNPPVTYPMLPSPVGAAACNSQQAAFTPIVRNAGDQGVTVPADINKNETVYLIRHAEAHPTSNFEDGNFVGAGQWRALALPGFLSSKISPDMVYSIDPSQSFTIPDVLSCSYVRPSMTILPYAIANNLPYGLVTGFFIGNATDTGVADQTRDFFFRGGTFTNKTILVAWEHEHYPVLIQELLKSYGDVNPPELPWPQTDYDTIWRVTLGANGNLRIDNELCEGIETTSLPAAAPQF